MRPCKVLGPYRTKVFHVKRFCPIERLNRSIPDAMEVSPVCGIVVASSSVKRHQAFGIAPRIGGIMRRALA
jgi:hypothetical protein